MLYLTCWVGEGSTCPKADSPPPPENQGTIAFIDRGRGLQAETAQSVLTVILKLAISGLIISVILTVLAPVGLQFQGQCVSISSRPVVGTVAYDVMATIWLSCS